MQPIQRPKPKTNLQAVLILIAILLAALLAWPADTLAAALDSAADRVLGQPDFKQSEPNSPAAPIGGLSARSLNSPFGIAIDRQSGRLFVADTFNNRVLSWPDAAGFASGDAADLVIGQPDFTSNLEPPAPTGEALKLPAGLAVDLDGNLFVADLGNHRVLAYSPPFSNGMAASRVFGQPDLVSAAPNNPDPKTGGLSSRSLHSPSGVATDGYGNLYVADSGNNRVLLYTFPLSTDPGADKIFGQPDFTTNTIAAQPSAESLRFPSGVALDPNGSLYIADADNNRVLQFDDPLAPGATADRVFGQPDFSSRAYPHEPTRSSLKGPSAIAIDAHGRLYIVDRFNSRVLVFVSPLEDGRLADLVIGQPDFTQGQIPEAPSEASLNMPTGAAVDEKGNLYLADSGNNRVLAYDPPIPIRVFLPLALQH